jgi:hypothetical protein
MISPMYNTGLQECQGIERIEHLQVPSQVPSQYKENFDITLVKAVFH